MPIDRGICCRLKASLDNRIIVHLVLLFLDIMIVLLAVSGLLRFEILRKPERLMVFELHGNTTPSCYTAWLSTHTSGSSFDDNTIAQNVVSQGPG